jgi:hypothetical protein
VRVADPEWGDLEVIPVRDLGDQLVRLRLAVCFNATGRYRDAILAELAPLEALVRQQGSGR